MERIKIVVVTLVLVLLFSAALKAGSFKNEAPANNRVTFEVTLDSAFKIKPYLIVYENNFFDRNTQPEQKEIAPVSSKGNTYLFVLTDQTKPMYFSIVYRTKIKKDVLVDSYHFEPGDQIAMRIKHGLNPNEFDVDFSGRNSAKYRCQNQFLDAVKMEVKAIKADTAFKYSDYSQTVRLIKAQFELIEKYQPEMSDYSYNLLKTDIEGIFFKRLFSDWHWNLSKALADNNKGKIDSLCRTYSKNYQFKFSGNVPDRILFDSRYYVWFMVEKIKVDNLVKYKKDNYPASFNDMKKIPNKLLRDKMLVAFFIRYSNKVSDNYEVFLKDALSVVSNKECLEKLKKFKHGFSGSKAYNFSLPDRNDKMVSLSDFKGKVVFVDFWFTGCGACKNFYKHTLVDVEKKYEDNKDVVFITISIDQEKYKWLSSIEKGEYTSAKAVNLYTNGEGGRHSVISFYNIIAFPKPMLIDRNGNVIKFTGNELINKVNLIRAIDNSLIL